MPVDHSEQHESDHLDEEHVPDGSDQAVVAGSPVEVRRHAGVAALVGGAASAVAIAYFWRASETSAVLDWAIFGVMAVIAGMYLAALVDARTPLLVADDLGVRIRLGDEWRGLPWEAIGQVVVHPRRGLLRDGRLVFSPRSLARALDGLDAKARRHVTLNQKMYGAALAVPVGTTTRVSTSGEGSVADEIAALALGRAEVVELDPRTLEVVTGGDPDEQAQSSAQSSAQASAPPSAEPDTTATVEEAAASKRREVFPRVHEQEPVAPTEPRPEVEDARDVVPPVTDDEALGDDTLRTPRRSILGGIGTIVSRVAKGRSHDVDGGSAPAAEAIGDTTVDAPDGDPSGPLPLAPTSALRETRPGLRAEATLDLPTAGNNALDPALAEGSASSPLPEGRELRRPGSVDLVFERVEVDDRVRPISTLGDPVEPLVIDDYVTEPAYDPVIGPELTAARTRLGLSVDELAERTRIRPHVIESIEVDDFAPCGGDFYARGHLRTLARILGKDAGPLLEAFEERYATAPINARRVFEAELATGMTGSIRSTVGGPSWSLMVGVVLCLILVWGVLRLFTTEPADMPTPVINGAAVVQLHSGEAAELPRGVH
jgi:hypothetical protein